MKQVTFCLRKATGYSFGILLCGDMAYGWVVLEKDGQGLLRVTSKYILKKSTLIFQNILAVFP